MMKEKPGAEMSSCLFFSFVFRNEETYSTGYMR